MSEEVINSIKAVGVVPPAPQKSVPSTSGKTRRERVRRPIDWVPDPSGWYDAVVIDKESGFIFVSLSNGDHVFCSSRVFTNLPNQHFCLVGEGDPAIVRLEIENEKLVALEVVLLREYEVDEQERGEVAWWDSRGYGMVKRDGCGCWIFTLDSNRNFYKGERVVIGGFEQSRKKQRPGTIATEIDLEVEETE